MNSRPIPERIKEQVYEGRSLAEMFTFAREYGVSDVKLVVGLPPYFRKGEGLVHNLGDGKGSFGIVTYEAMTKMVDCLTTEEQKRKLLAGKRDIDMSVIMPTSEGERSYRLNLAMHKGTPMIIVRVVPSQIRTLEQLSMPDVLTTYFRSVQDGLVLVTGPTGSGKSSTLATMVDDIKRRNSDEIITIEDPIEYLHGSGTSLVLQREIGRDVSSYRAALRSAMREDPDVIVVGEIRDRATVRASLEASYTGHLVLGTLHTSDTVQSINRMIDLFPVSMQGDIASQLADNLRLVCSQQLPPKIGGGRIMVMERLKVTPAISHNIRKRDPDGKFVSAIQTGKNQGMQTMEDALLDGFKSGNLEKDVAFRYARRKEGFMERLDHVALGRT